MATVYGDLKNRTLAATSLQNYVYDRSTTNTTTISFTLPPFVPGKTLAIATGFWDSSRTITTPSGWTLAVTNEDASEYPEGETVFRILQSGDTSVSLVADTADQTAGVLTLWSFNDTISSVSVGNTAWSDGPSSLNSTMAADSPATVASGTVRLCYYVLTGRIQTTYIQNPTPTFVAGGWTHIDGDPLGVNDTINIDNMDFAYKILNAGDTDVSEQITTNDTGRQAHHLMRFTVS